MLAVRRFTVHPAWHPSVVRSPAFYPTKCYSYRLYSSDTRHLDELAGLLQTTWKPDSPVLVEKEKWDYVRSLPYPWDREPSSDTDVVPTIWERIQFSDGSSQLDHLNSSFSGTSPESFLRGKVSNESIIHLIECKRFAEADQMRKTMLRSGSVIRPNMIYLHPSLAIAAYQFSDIATQGEMFADWFSLIPDASGRPTRPFDTLFSMLCTRCEAHPDMMRHFGLICAAKGYAVQYGARTVTWIARCDPAHCSEFVNDLENMVLSHVMAYMRTDVTALLRSFRSAQVLALVDDGDLLQACEVALTNYGPLTEAAYSRLSQKLRDTPEDVDTGQNELYKKLQAHRKKLKDSKALANRSAKQSKYLASELRTLKRSLPLTESNMPQPVEAGTLAQFIRSYYLTGRTRGLELLRRRARRTELSRHLWVHAEMFYYSVESNPAAALRVFVLNCEHSLFPREELAQAIGTSFLDHSHSLFQSFTPHKVKPQSANSPIPELVWKALISLSSSIAAHDKLYAHFLRLHNKDERLAPRSIFVEFIALFNSRRRVGRASSILHDLQKPTAFEFGAVAEGFVRKKDTTKALQVLEYLEQSQSHFDPESIFAVYARIFVTLVKRNLLEAAEEVKRRMQLLQEQPLPRSLAFDLKMALKRLRGDSQSLSLQHP